MTEKLGVLLVDVPEPRLFKYHSLVCDREFFLDGHVFQIKNRISLEGL